MNTCLVLSSFNNCKCKPCVGALEMPDVFSTRSIMYEPSCWPHVLSFFVLAEYKSHLIRVYRPRTAFL